MNKNSSRIYTCPPGAPFVPTLVPWLLEHFSKLLPQTLVFMPNQRSLTALSTALSIEMPLEDQPTLICLGEAHTHGKLISIICQRGPLPLMQSDATFQAKLARAWFENHPCDATNLAILQDFLDLFSQSVRDEVDWSHLDQLIPENLSQHRQMGLKHFDLLLKHTQHIIAADGLTPDSFHRWFMDQLRECWQNHAPQGPVIFAGSTGSQPVIARLMKSLYDTGHGTIILPGYIPESKQETPIPLAHPSYLMERLVRDLGDPVIPLSVPPSFQTHSETIASLQQRMFPLQKAPLESLHTFQLHGFTAQNVQEEVSMIAHLVREAVAQNIPSTAIILNDSAMIAGLKATLDHEGIFVANPHGLSLSKSSLGHFALQVLSWPLENWSIVPLLSLVKNSLCHESIRILRPALETFEKKVLRHFPIENDVRTFMNTPQDMHLNHLFSHLQKAFRDFWIQHGKLLPLGTWAHIHKTTLRNLLDLNALSQPTFLLLEDMWKLWIDTHLVQKMTLDDYLTFFRQQVSLLSLPDPQIQTRVEILGTLEARLLHVQRLIIPNCNEGSWPRSPHLSPWLGERTRQELGFAPFEQTIGQSAHDFMRCLAAPEIYITRSLYQNGMPTLPSPWLIRLELALKDQWPATFEKMAFLSTTQKTTVSQKTHPSWKAPYVPFIHKPLTFSATQLEKLFKNPYAFYGAHILKLKPLDPFGYILTPARYGQILHQIMHHFVLLKRSHQTREALKALAHPLMHKAHFSRLQTHRFEQTLDHIFDKHLIDLDQSTQMHPEIEGLWTFSLKNHELSLKARADRLDLLASEDVHIIDYKTGQLPTRKGVESLEDVQLLHEALILEKGGFKSLGVRICEKIEYRQTKIGAPSLISLEISQPALGALQEEFQHMLRERLAAYIEDEYCFHYIQNPGRFTDPYAHLGRFEIGR